MFVHTILPLKMEVNYEKKKNQKTSYLLIMFDYDHYIRAIWDTSTYAGVNRSISSDRVKLQQLIIMEIYITCIRQYKNQGASCIL